MLLWIVHCLDWLSRVRSVAALDDVTIRAGLAAVAVLVVTLGLGRRWVHWLRARFREPIKSDSPRLLELHEAKRFTPTMGGVFIVAGILAGSLAFGDLANRGVQAAVLLTIGLAVLGAIDDLVKIRGISAGLSARTKLLGQLAVAAVAVRWIYPEMVAPSIAREPSLPLFGVWISPGSWYIPLAVLVVVGASNAVNLTDGLDGLAGGCLVIAMAAMVPVAFVAGDATWAGQWGVAHVPGAREIIVPAAATIGAVLGFLRFNRHPAHVFMGDTGSLPLGGLLGLVSVACRQPWLLAVVGGVFVAEAASVMIQVGYYKWRRRRVFLCAPLHHHFQFQGWPETRIVARFWMASALCAAIGLGLLAVGSSILSPLQGNERALRQTVDSRSNLPIPDEADRPRNE